MRLLYFIFKVEKKNVNWGEKEQIYRGSQGHLKFIKNIL
jgi:hypothetical protein